MILHSGQFNEYTVEFRNTRSGPDNTNDLTFSSTPVIMNRYGSYDEFYKPIRSSSCDITIVNNGLLTDLYSDNSNNQVYVLIKKNNSIIWEGYLTPNTYSQEITQNLDNITMTAIDPISMLKYVRVDKILTKPRICTYGELIGLVLDYISVDTNTILIENSVNYADANYTGIVDLQMQVSNFWDEDDTPSALYEMLGEILRVLGMCIVYHNHNYYIYDLTKTLDTRTFISYIITSSGLYPSNQQVNITPRTLEYENDWISQSGDSSVHIDQVYKKVQGVSSSCVPSFSAEMVFDNVDPESENYDKQWLNVQRNKVKGYRFEDFNWIRDEDDDWLYIWNAVYVDENYNIEVSDEITGWANINNAYRYYIGYPEHGWERQYGQVANYYGSAYNPWATGKVQTAERTVEVNNRITAFAPDNGVVPEFLEDEDFGWTFDPDWEWPEEEDERPVSHPHLYKDSAWDSGHRIDSYTPRVVYHQTYENMTLLPDAAQTIDLKMTHSFSRTGIDVPIEIKANCDVSNPTYYVIEDEQANEAVLDDCSVNLIPDEWKENNVIVYRMYFNKWNADGHYMSLKPVWDRRRIDIYIDMGRYIYQFNGNRWVQDTSVKESNSFYLEKMLNMEKIYHNDFKYDVINIEGTRYSLLDEDIEYITDAGGGVVDEEDWEHHTTTKHTIPVWVNDYKNKTDKGELSIFTPETTMSGVTVVIDIWNSSMLGITGNNTDNVGSTTTTTRVVYDLNSSDQGYSEEHGSHPLSWWGIASQQHVWEDVPYDLLPYNCSYIKAEHLDINIEVSVPKSNLGQMFDESNVRYSKSLTSNFTDTYDIPDFLVNTYHPIVKNSFSYIMYHGAFAEPDKFMINGVSTKPEVYMVQAYMNYLSKIRYVYTKTAKGDMDNFLCWLTTPELDCSYLRILSDSWDMANNRHVIECVNDIDIEVDEIDTYSVKEIPRKARNELFNLPNSRKS